MNKDLRTLLSTALGATGPVTEDWSQVLMLHNLGDVPRSTDEGGDFVRNRGFNLLLLDRRGNPSCFCKFRPTGDELATRETAVREFLSSDSQLAGTVPWTHGARTGDIQVQASKFLPGKTYDKIVRRLSVENWTATIQEILHISERITARAGTLMPKFVNASDEVDVLQMAAPFLRYLSQTGVEAEQTTNLQNAIKAGGSLPGHLQHGDLWPSNVIRHAGSWWILDFELFGEVRVPLYDVFHLLYSSTALRTPAAERVRPGRWVDLILGDSSAAAGSRQTVRSAAGRASLGSHQVGSALVYYLVDVATRIHRRGTPPSYWEPYYTEVRRIADILKSGDIYDDLLKHMAD